MNKKVVYGIISLALCSSIVNGIGFSGIVNPEFKGEIIHKGDKEINIKNSDDILNEINDSISEFNKKQNNQIVIKNKTINDKVKLSRGSNNPYYNKSINIIVSYYSGREEENGKGNRMKNALGGKLDSVTIAVPRNIPLGTKIKLTDENGNEIIKIAKDYGNTKYIKWIDENTMRIDVCMPYSSKKELMKLGIKKYKGEIIRWGFDNN